MSSSVGMIIPNLWKMFETTNQYVEIDGNIQMILGKLRL